MTPNIKAKFGSNPINLDTLLIRLNQGKTRKKQNSSLGTERFPHFSDLVLKRVVNMAMPPSNGTQLSTRDKAVHKTLLRFALKNINCSVLVKQSIFSGKPKSREENSLANPNQYKRTKEENS